MSLIWRPFTQMQKALRYLPQVTQAKKTTLFLQNGTTLIDAISSWWVISHGHCEPSLVKAIAEQSKKLDQVLFANFTHKKAEDLVKELQVFLPKKLQKFFFSDNGSTAVEVALKMALQSQAQRGEPQRKRFLSFSHSYHGDTVGAMSVSARGIFTKNYRSLLFPVHTCSQGVLSSDPDSSFYQDFEKKIEKHHKNLAAVIIEPLIQGAGGMIIWPVFALERIGRITKEAGAYLIFDEIMTGFGRTGTMFAMDQIQTKPDILCLSKGLTGGFLPLALTISTKDIYNNFLSLNKEKALLHGHSFTGNPLSSAVALASLKLLKKNKKKLLQKWKTIEKINKERLEIFKNHPQIQDVRHKGLIAVVQKKEDSSYGSFFAEKAYKKAFKQGVFLRPLGAVVYILPPYCITKQELHKTWDVIQSLFFRTFRKKKNTKE